MLIDLSRNAGWQLAAQVECRKRPGLQQVANKLPTSFQLVRLVGCGLEGTQ